MAGKVLSIEIDQSFTRVVEIEYKSNKPKIYSFFTFETPEGTVIDGVIGENKAGFAERLRAGMKRNRIGTSRVVFTINSGQIVTRSVSIPAVKENRIQGVLLANSSEYFPVDMSQYQLGYRILGKDEAGKQLHLAAYIVPKRLIESYYELARGCGLTIQSMDYIGNSIYQSMKQHMQEDLAVTIKIEEHSTYITVLRDGSMALQRNFGYGLKELVDVVRESNYFALDLSHENAWKYLRRENCVLPTVTQDADVEFQLLRRNAAEALQPLISNIARALDYYVSRNSNIPIQEIVLIGIGAECKGLAELIKEELSTEVIILEELENLSFTGKTSKNRFLPSEYIACIGAVIEPFGLASGSAKKKKEKSSDGDSMLVPGLIFSALCVGAVALTGIPMLQMFGLQTVQQGLKNRIVQLQPAQEAYDAYSLAQLEYLDVVTMDFLSQTPNDALLDFLQEFEEKCPSNILLDNISAGTEGVTLSVKASKKEEIAELIVQMRDFGTVKSLETTGFSEDDDDSGIIKYTCTIVCTYAVAEAAPGETEADSDVAAAE